MFDSLVLRLEQIITAKELITPESTIVIGLSGGPDSVFLLHALSLLAQKYNYTLIAAHLDHGWRSESAQDVTFCRALAEHYNCKFISAHASEIALDKNYKHASEEMGRILRRTFLEKVADEHSAHAIALGHHQNDQQETFFIRLMRGASLSGLSGIQAKRDRYIRPLLSFFKQEILDYLTVHTLDYLIDRTNTSDKYLRNRVRNQVIPELIKTDGRFELNFKKTLDNLNEIEQYLKATARDFFNKISSHNQDNLEQNYLAINLSELILAHKTLFPYIIMEWLCAERVPFTPSTKFFDEIFRFFAHSKHSTEHRVHPQWYFKKSKKSIRIIKSDC